MASTSRTHLLLLGALCAILYGTGLTTHGLTNWQEAQRALVAREMQERIHTGTPGAWVVPTINGNPYLAKPPFFYWAQIALAEIRGRTTSEFELRAVVALAGLLGVLATYIAAKGLFGEAPPPEGVRSEREGWARQAALWSSLCLATGILYVRSSRIGELDILLAPCVVVAVAGIVRSWRAHRQHRQSDLGAVALATIAGVVAALTKGPAGVAVIALAAYGGIALWCAFTREPLESFVVPRFTLPGGSKFPRLAQPEVKAAPESPAWMITVGAITLGVPAVIAAALQVHSFGDAIGAAGIGLAFAFVGVVIARLLQPARLLAFWAALSRTHPAVIIGVPILAFWVWWLTVVGYIGSDAAHLAARAEADDNLHFFVPAAAITNLEALVYGVGLGSIAFYLTLLWIVKDRPRVRPGWAVLLAWTIFGTLLFTVTTKGVVRYLTPIWPGVAMLAGLFIATLLAESNARASGRMRTALSLIVVILFVTQAAWYAYGRERYFAERSPRALVEEILSIKGVEADRLTTFEFRSPAIDYYAAHPVQPVGEIGMRTSMAGIEPWTLEHLAAELRRSHKPVTMLLRLSGPDALGDWSKDSATDRLAGAGFIVVKLDTQHHFITDSGRSVIGAALVFPADADEDSKSGVR